MNGKKLAPFVYVVALGTFVVVLDTTFMNVSITALVDDLNTTVDAIQGAMAMNALMMAMFVLLGGKLGDVLGMKRTYLVGVGLTIAGSLVASIAQNLPVFVLGWCLIQGIGSAFMMPNIQSIIRSHTAGEGRAQAYGLLGGVGALGTAVGPIIGGFLTAYLAWRWAFWIEILALLVVLVFSRTIPGDEPQKPRPAIDWLGVLLQAVAMLLVVSGITLADSYGILIASRPLYLGPLNLTPFGLSPAVTLSALGVLFLVLFSRWERHRESQGKAVLLRLDLFQNGGFTNSLYVRSIQVMVLVGLLFTFPLFLQVTFGLDAFQTGLITLPFSLTLIVVVPLAVRLAQRLPPRRVVRIGWLIGLAGSLLLVVLVQASETPAHVIPGLVVFALGMALVVAQMANFVMSSVQTRDAPEASGVMATFEQIGNSVGVAVLSTILALALTQGLLGLVVESEVLPAELQQEFVTSIESSEGIEIVDNIEVYQAAQAEQYPKDISREIVTLYDRARTNAFAITMLAVAFVCAIGYLLSANLPGRSLEELTADTSGP